MTVTGVNGPLAYTPWKKSTSARLLLEIDVRLFTGYSFIISVNDFDWVRDVLPKDDKKMPH